MTTDPFITAARAEAVRAWTTPQFDGGNVIEMLGQHMAEWARDHLAEQEPTDAEVEAAARAICEGTEAGDLGVWGPETQRRFRSTARAALTAAREARHDVP